jgi:hypothetical protein
MVNALSIRPVVSLFLNLGRSFLVVKEQVLFR